MAAVTEINERIVAEADDRGESLLVDEFLRLIEQYHTHERPGIAWATLEAYTEAMAGTDHGHSHDMEGVLDAIDDRLTDGEYRTDAVYRVGDDRVSAYPASWHDELGGEIDLREYVRFLTNLDLDDENGAELGANGGGVPEQLLLEVASIVGRADPEAVKSRLEDLRERHELVEDADQHPNARVRLPENADNLRDSSIDS
ncbi:hypothetical protein [Halococcus thailandensis]|uniref:Uncharacterized protein n=1 Tax=Halococcus thailandensis JCM 13552 TaxID=1227457 RepID=M0MV46_9EURY|nr:hypothetical protein [Halococcus thailandensis]EMA49471.1 hypothetical protein C451_18083 [Halococcus thailandensis JCM 13552]